MNQNKLFRNSSFQKSGGICGAAEEFPLTELASLQISKDL